MLLLKTTLFSGSDFFVFPFVVLLLYFISRRIVHQKDILTRSLFLKTFWFRVVVLLLFTLLMQFYYGGGDSYRYYVSMLDMRKAIADGGVTFGEVFFSEKATLNNPLSSYFYMDELAGNQYYMQTVSNYSVPRLALPLGFLCFNSYLSMGMVFSFIALLGSHQLYRIFSFSFPAISGQVGIACFLIPGVCFWSSGLMKDPLSFGAMGLLMGACYDIFTQKKRILVSILIGIISFYIIYIIKPYILVAFFPALIVFIFTRWSINFHSLYLRRLMFVLMLGMGAAMGFLFYNYFTSDSGLEQFGSEKILEQIEKQRGVYELYESSKGGSFFSLGSEQPALQFPLAFIATYYRPFLFEVDNPVMLLSALEAFLLLLFTIYVFVKVGVLRFFRIIFFNPFTFFCFLFSLFFGIAVGLSTANFGTLARYKIPAMPFFLLMLILVLHLSHTPLPGWIRKRIRF